MENKFSLQHWSTYRFPEELLSFVTTFFDRFSLKKFFLNHWQWINKYNFYLLSIHMFRYTQRFCYEKCKDELFLYCLCGMGVLCSVQLQMNLLNWINRIVIWFVYYVSAGDILWIICQNNKWFSDHWLINIGIIYRIHTFRFYKLYKRKIMKKICNYFSCHNISIYLIYLCLDAWNLLLDIVMPTIILVAHWLSKVKISQSNWDLTEHIRRYFFEFEKASD